MGAVRAYADVEISWRENVLVKCGIRTGRAWQHLPHEFSPCSPERW